MSRFDLFPCNLQKASTYEIASAQYLIFFLCAKRFVSFKLVKCIRNRDFLAGSEMSLSLLWMPLCPGEHIMNYFIILLNSIYQYKIFSKRM